jgi:hypothetical protein
MGEISRKSGGRLLVALAGSAVLGSVYAHHSPALFDQSRVVTLNATVTKFEWANPHVFIQVEVMEEGGHRESWDVEADAPSALIPLGWSKDSLKPGERITVEASPAKNPARNTLLGRSITKDDGTVLMPKPLFVRAASSPSSSVAEGLAGVWLPRREDYFAFVRATNSSDWSLTPNGLRHRDTYNGVATPQADCIPVSAPAITLYPVHTELVVSRDRVLIRTDWMNVERVVYTDGRRHPENGERTVQGHTIGHWEGETLVMDTALFSEHILGTNARVPSGRQKHVFERLSLSEDRKALTYEFRVEDPEYLLEAVTGKALWDYRPDLRPSGVACSLDAARRPLAE